MVACAIYRAVQEPDRNMSAGMMCGTSLAKTGGRYEGTYIW